MLRKSVIALKWFTIAWGALCFVMAFISFGHGELSIGLINLACAGLMFAMYYVNRNTLARIDNE